MLKRVHPWRCNITIDKVAVLKLMPMERYFLIPLMTAFTKFKYSNRVLSQLTLLLKWLQAPFSTPILCFAFDRTGGYRIVLEWAETKRPGCTFNQEGLTIFRTAIKLLPTISRRVSTSTTRWLWTRNHYIRNTDSLLPTLIIFSTSRIKTNRVQTYRKIESYCRIYNNSVCLTISCRQSNKGDRWMFSKL